MLPKDVAAGSRQEEVISKQSEVPQFEETRAPLSPEQARIAHQRRVLARVKEYWAPPAEAPLDINCDVRVEQFPDGEVISAAVIDTCGSSAMDGSIIDAVYRASPLPMPNDPSLFDRELNFRFSVP